MTQTDALVGLTTIVELERGRLGRREHLDGAVLQLDLAGGELGVQPLLFAGHDGAGDPHHVLAAEIRCAVDLTHCTMPV